MTSGPGHAAPYAPPRRYALCGKRNKEESGSTAGNRDSELVSPLAPPQRVPPDGQVSAGDVRAAIDRRLNRAFIHRDLGAHLAEYRGALLDIELIHQLLPRHGRQLQ